MAVRNLVFLRHLLSKPKAFGTAIFWACCARCPNPVFFQCFWVFVLKCCVSPRSLGGGKVPPDAQDLHPQHHQDYLVAMNLSLLSFLQILVVICCFKQCWNWPVRGLGGVKCSDTLRNYSNFQKMSVFSNSPPVRSRYCETSPALSCFWKSIFWVFEGGC